MCGEKEFRTDERISSKNRPHSASIAVCLIQIEAKGKQCLILNLLSQLHNLSSFREILGTQKEADLVTKRISLPNFALTSFHLYFVFLSFG